MASVGRGQRQLRLFQLRTRLHDAARRGPAVEDIPGGLDAAHPPFEAAAERAGNRIAHHK
jgi:hypothetical protein